MAKTKVQKAEELSRLEKIADAASSVFVQFKGLTVGKANAMRRKLKESNVGYFVAKKSLLKKAFGGSKIEGEMPVLDGETAIAYGEDQTGPAREIYSFQKELDGAISIVGGIFDGKYLGKEAMLEIAKIPGREALYGKMVGSLKSPIIALVLTLKALAEKGK